MVIGMGEKMRRSPVTIDHDPIGMVGGMEWLIPGTWKKMTLKQN